VEPAESESGERAVATTINGALGLSGEARITSVQGRPVSSAVETRSLLIDHLNENRPFHVTIENDHLKTLYVMPSEE
jgi:hypothetical protein